MCKSRYIKVHINTFHFKKKKNLKKTMPNTGYIHIYIHVLLRNSFSITHPILFNPFIGNLPIPWVYPTSSNHNTSYHTSMT